MASEKVLKLIEDVKSLTVLELADLVKELEEEFGVSAVAAASAGCISAVAAVSAGAASAAIADSGALISIAAIIPSARTFFSLFFIVLSNSPFQEQSGQVRFKLPESLNL